MVNKRIFELRAEFGQVIRLERNPNGSSFLALIRLLRSGFLSYINAPSNLKIGSFIAINPNSFDSLFFKRLRINSVALPLYKIPKGSYICNIEKSFLSGPSFCKGAGTKAKLQSVSVRSGLVSLLMPSGKTQYLPLTAHAFTGIMSNSQHQLYKFYKAGQRIVLGNRPSVRGVAMNPVDHPHGGGEGKTSGGRPSVTPWGFLIKGFKTRSKNTSKKFLKLKTKFLSSSL